MSAEPRTMEARAPEVRAGPDWLLVALFALPLGIMLARGLVLPAHLSNLMSLQHVPAEMHPALENLLLVPVGALAVVLLRLTLGMEVLGVFQPILMAMAFQVIGVPQGLAFLAAVLVFVCALRSPLTPVRADARFAVALSLLAAALFVVLGVGALQGVAWLREFAFMPVMALCLTCESFSRVLGQEGTIEAVWRTLMTVLAACVALAVATCPSVFDIFVRYPELLLVNTGFTVLISRRFAIRLFDRQAALARRAEERVKVAVVWNNDRSNVINRFGPPAPERRARPSVENVVGALRERGHEALLCEGDSGLLQALGRFMPPGPSGRPGGMVFNMAHGIQGECRHAHVPAMLEMAGVPYTGSSPLGHALALDKALAKRLLRDAGVATPDFRVMRTGQEDTGALRFPVVLKPAQGASGFGVHFVEERAHLGAFVQALVARHGQPVLVEEYVDGREICIGLIGNGEPDVLPFVEHDFGARRPRFMSGDEATRRAQDEPLKACPARAGAELARHLREIAVGAFRACQCRDYARIDVRIDGEGRPFVLEIDSMAALGVNASYALAARTAGMSFPALVERILDVAHRRCFGEPLAAHAEPLAQQSIGSSTPEGATLAS